MNFLALVPWYYRLLTIAALVAATFTSGAVMGVRWQQGRDAVKEHDVLVRKVETVKTVVKADNAALKAAQARVAALEADNVQLQNEVNQHARDLPDPASCYLAPQRVRTIRRAWGLDLGVDPAGGQAPLPGPGDRPVPVIGEPQRRGSVGGPVGPAVPEVPKR